MTSVVVGRIVGLFGVRGWIKVYSYTQPKENLFAYRLWQIGGVPRRLEAGQIHGKGLIAKLADCDDRDTATGLIDAEICIDRTQLPALPQGEYYWNDLIGLRVINRAGEELGQVCDLLETGAHDVLVVKGAGEHLIPFVPEQFIERIDIAGGIIEADWDPGWGVDF